MGNAQYENLEDKILLHPKDQNENNLAVALTFLETSTTSFESPCRLVTSSFFDASEYQGNKLEVYKKVIFLHKFSNSEANIFI